MLINGSSFLMRKGFPCAKQAEQVHEHEKSSIGLDRSEDHGDKSRNQIPNFHSSIFMYACKDSEKNDILAGY